MVLLAFIDKIKDVEQLFYKLLRRCIPFSHHLYLYSIYIYTLCVCDRLQLNLHLSTELSDFSKLRIPFL